MNINPNLRYCENAPYCREVKKDADCYLGWKPERYPVEMAEGGLHCERVDKWYKNISGFELLVRINIKGEIMKVRILKCSGKILWYRNRIGEVFEVNKIKNTPEGSIYSKYYDTYKVQNVRGALYIRIEDGEPLFESIVEETIKRSDNAKKEETSNH